MERDPTTSMEKMGCSVNIQGCLHFDMMVTHPVNSL